MTVYSRDKIQEFVSNGDASGLSVYMKEHNLILKDDKIVPSNIETYYKEASFWDGRQHTR